MPGRTPDLSCDRVSRFLLQQGQCVLLGLICSLFLSSTVLSFSLFRWLIVWSLGLRTDTVFTLSQPCPVDNNNNTRTGLTSRTHEYYHLIKQTLGMQLTSTKRQIFDDIDLLIHDSVDIATLSQICLYVYITFYALITGILIKPSRSTSGEVT